jgi:hypothetical protein
VSLQCFAPQTTHDDFLKCRECLYTCMSLSSYHFTLSDGEPRSTQPLSRMHAQPQSTSFYRWIGQQPCSQGPACFVPKRRWPGCLIVAFTANIHLRCNTVAPPTLNSPSTKDSCAVSPAVPQSTWRKSCALYRLDKGVLSLAYIEVGGC